jgi:hypothetical protein
MPEQNEPKKETLRIKLSPQPTANLRPEKPDAIRINLPARPPQNGPLAANSQPARAKADARAIATLRASVPIPPETPKEESGRTTVQSDPPRKTVMQVAKPHSLPDMPGVEAPNTPFAPTPERRSIIHEMPRPLCWTLLGASAAILIIQIWSYLS